MPEIIAAALAAGLSVSAPPPDAACRAYFAPGLDQFVNPCPAPPGGKYRVPGGIDVAGFALARSAAPARAAPWRRPHDPLARLRDLPRPCCAPRRRVAFDPAPSPPAAVPLPAPSGLLLAALATLAWAARRPRKPSGL